MIPQSMEQQILTTDNSSRELEVHTQEAHLENLQKIAAKPLCELDLDEHPQLLIFPQDFNAYGDNIGKEYIIGLEGNKLVTGNIMGFVGYHNTQVSIRSRFAQNDGNDYFLHYMLQKVFSVNLIDLKFNSDQESIFDFLIYLFPSFLKRAIRFGLYKEYQTRDYNDANVRGRIDVNRHIRQNIPFSGRVAYTTREHVFDNHVTQLIRHTIEYIASHPYCGSILNNDEDTKEAISLIKQATSTYNRNERRQVMNQNIRPVLHPYYCEYRNLRSLCMNILRHEELKYGLDDDEIYGILFDGAWLWEEYLNTFLSTIGLKHPQNKIGKGGRRIFKDNIGYETVMPDFYNNNMVLDAKYKGYSNWSCIGREDRFQILSYMYLYCVKQGGFIVPVSNNLIPVTRNLNRYEGQVSLLGMHVAHQCHRYQDYVDYMKEIEDKMINLLLSFEVDESYKLDFVEKRG